MNFSAVILAGGQSSRMGRDKAWLEIGGEALLARQIGLARKVGAVEVFISGRVAADYSAFGCPVLRDKYSDAGPLAGIERALDAMRSPLLLALAVDLPEMSEDFLRRLSAGAAESFGAIPQLAGQIEPLAAFYPKAALPFLVKLLEGYFPSPMNPLTRRDATLSPTGGEGRGEGALRQLEIQGENSPQPVSRFVPAEPPRPTERRAPSRPVGEPTQQRAGTVPDVPVHGEGEPIAKKSASAKRFAELCVQSGLAGLVELDATETRYFANWNSPADLPAARSCDASSSVIDTRGKLTAKNAENTKTRASDGAG